VRAQATRIYAKSETSGRAQFISLFMEELMAGEIGGDDPGARPSAGGPGEKAGDQDALAPRGAA
jgi:hypothetical protein